MVPLGPGTGAAPSPCSSGGAAVGLLCSSLDVLHRFVRALWRGQEASPRPRLSVPTNTAREVTSREIPVPIFRGQLGPRQSGACTLSVLAALQLRAALLLLTPSRPCRAAALAHPYTHPAHSHVHTQTPGLLGWKHRGLCTQTALLGPLLPAHPTAPSTPGASPTIGASRVCVGAAWVVSSTQGFWVEICKSLVGEMVPRIKT